MASPAQQGAEERDQHDGAGGRDEPRDDFTGDA
jgi:hypothetical protein